MKKKGSLYVVATPIGNLKDITFRAIEALEKADFIACEDTRVTRKLLSHYNIRTRTISYHQHSRIQKIGFIVEALEKGKNVALVTDAGTPGLSDPGCKLIAEAQDKEIRIIPVPGPSALTSIISISGINFQKFTFLGFPPHKKGRETFFKNVAASQYPVVYYDSPHRVIKNLELLEKTSKEKKVILGRELTKMFEEVVKGDTREVIGYFESNEDKIKGEFVIVVY